MNTGNMDYKYYTDDLTKLLIGAKFSYAELLGEENLSFRYRSIIKRILLQEVEPDTTVESHMYYMTADSESFDAYKRLRTRVRFYCPEVKKSLTGREDVRYIEHTVKIDELVSVPPAEKEERGIIIHEIQIAKPSLMVFVL